MDARRYLCSELVTLRQNGVDSVVNLEEIWGAGALLESESPLTVDSAVEILAPQATLSGQIVAVEQHEFGWRVEVEFSPLTPWTPEQFRPKHLLHPSQLQSG